MESGKFPSTKREDLEDHVMHLGKCLVIPSR